MCVLEASVANREHQGLRGCCGHVTSAVTTHVYECSHFATLRQHQHQPDTRTQQPPTPQHPHPLQDLLQRLSLPCPTNPLEPAATQQQPGANTNTHIVSSDLVALPATRVAVVSTQQGQQGHSICAEEGSSCSSSVTAATKLGVNMTDAVSVLVGVQQPGGDGGDAGTGSNREQQQLGHDREQQTDGDSGVAAAVWSVFARGHDSHTLSNWLSEHAQQLNHTSSQVLTAAAAGVGGGGKRADSGESSSSSDDSSDLGDDAATAAATAVGPIALTQEHMDALKADTGW